MQTGFSKHLSDPMVNKTGRKIESSVITVGRVGTSVEIKNVLLGVRPLGTVKGKTISAASGKPNQRNEDLIKYKQS